MRAHFLKYLLPGLLAGCTLSAPEPPVPEAPARAYDDTVYCFNRRSIVSLDGHFGLLDVEDGTEVLPPAYDGVEFLSDDIALLSLDGAWYLATKDGRVFAENADWEVLEQNYLELYEGVTAADRRYWDGVLDAFDALCTDCIALQSNPGAYSAVLEKSEHLKRTLAGASGTLDEAQRERFADIVSRYKARRK